MGRTRWMFRYFTRIATILLCIVLSTGCQRKSQTAELEEVSVEADEMKITEKDSEEATLKEESEKETAGENSDVTSGGKEGAGKLYVHVCGHVNQPGVYELQSNSRVFEAIEAAGGMTTTAAFSYLNQAELLEDGKQIYVPSQEEVDSGKAASVASSSQGEQALGEANAGSASVQDEGKVNLNTASKEELMTLSGIGDVRAQAILKYREEHGEFRSIEELMEVEGIKKGTFQKLKDQIKI